MATERHSQETILGLIESRQGASFEYSNLDITLKISKLRTSENSTLQQSRAYLTPPLQESWEFLHVLHILP